MNDVDIFDLDHTLMNTEGKWFGPALDQLAREIGRDRGFVEHVFGIVCQATFTFDALLAGLDVPLGRRARLRDEIMDSLAVRAQVCLYPGMLDLLWRRKKSARMVLVTAGDADWQRWKFSQLYCLHDVFDEADRYFVPLDGSKADVVRRYRTEGRLAFIDDSVRWHREVAANVPDVLHVRPIWPDTPGAADHPDDGHEWHVARSHDDLVRLLGV